MQTLGPKGHIGDIGFKGEFGDRGFPGEKGKNIDVNIYRTKACLLICP